MADHERHKRKADVLAGKGSVAGSIKRERLGSKNDPDLTGRSPGRRVAGDNSPGKVNRRGYSRHSLEDA